MIPYVERLFKRSEAASLPSAQAQGFTRPLITALRPAPLSLHLSDASHAPHQGGSGYLVGSARRAAPPRKDSMRTHKKLLRSCSSFHTGLSQRSHQQAPRIDRFLTQMLQFFLWDTPSDGRRRHKWLRCLKKGAKIKIPFFDEGDE